MPLEGDGLDLHRAAFYSLLEQIGIMNSDRLS